MVRRHYHSTFALPTGTHSTHNTSPRTRCRTSPDHLSACYPVLHSLHVLLIFFSILYLAFSYFPLPSRFLPITTTDNANSGPPTYQPFPFSSVCKCLDHISIHFFIKGPATCILRYHNKHNSVLLTLILLDAGDIEVNPGPTSSTPLIISHLNIRSATSITPELDKPASIQETISDHKLDILSLSETWLPLDTLPSVLNSLTPPSYSILSSPRPSGCRGGGLALIYRSTLKLAKIPLPNYTSFESLCARLTTTSDSKPLSFI